MASNNNKDQFEHGRIPLRPLAYSQRENAQTDELIIDFGNTGTETYHMYIASSNDPTKLIDLTEMIVAKALPAAKFNVDQFEISLEGVDDPSTLKDVINYIYKRFLYPENYGLFDYARDSYKLFDDSAVNTLLRDAEGRVILPITFADNVFFKNGKSFQDQYNEITRLAINRQTIYTKKDTKSYKFLYPFENYMDDVEIRYNSRYLTSEEYFIGPVLDDDNNFTYGLLTLNLEEIGSNDQIDFIFTYNAKAYEDVKYQYMDGKNISMKSIPISRLEKVSDSFTNTDETAVATSKGLYNLYLEMLNMVDHNVDNASYNIDISEYDNFIHIDSSKNIIEYDYFMCNVLIGTAKRFDAAALIAYNGGSITNVPIVDARGKDLTKGLPSGKIARFMWCKEERKVYLMTTDISQLRTGRWVYKALESEKEICYCGMQYELGACITVYKNGLRLFEDLDYSINTKDEKITLFNPTTEGDVIIFEALYL
jgi:hypothetical protein